MSDAASEKEIPQETFARFLDGLEQDDFVRRFTFSHEELRQGGEELASGKGDFAEIFLAASAGLAGLRGLADRLDAKADEMFSGRKTDRPIKKAFSRFQEAIKAKNEATLSADDWHKLETRLSEAQNRAADLKTSRDVLAREHARLGRVESARAPIAAYQNARDEIQSLGRTPRFEEAEINAFRESVKSWLDQSARTSAWSRDLQALRVDGVDPDSARKLTSRQQEIDSLLEKSRELQALSGRRADLLRKAEQARERARSIRIDLFPDLDDAVDKSMRIALAKRLEIHDLANKEPRVAVELKTAREASRTKQAALKALEDSLEELEVLPNEAALALKAASESAADEGGADAKLEKAQAEVKKRHKQRFFSFHD